MARKYTIPGMPGRWVVKGTDIFHRPMLDHTTEDIRVYLMGRDDQAKSTDVIVDSTLLVVLDTVYSGFSDLRDLEEQMKEEKWKEPAAQEKAS